jgi:hypothetical protein
MDVKLIEKQNEEEVDPAAKMTIGLNTQQSRQSGEAADRGIIKHKMGGRPALLHLGGF